MSEGTPIPNGLIEDVAAEALRKPVRVETAIGLSIAISLKRIADMLDGTSMGICCTQTIFNPNARQQ